MRLLGTTLVLLWLVPALVSGQDEKDRQALEAAFRKATLLKNQRKYAEATAAMQTVLALHRRLHGEDVAFSNQLENLAYLHRLQGQWKEADALYQRSLKIRESKLGKDHLRVAETLHRLAQTAEAANQDDRAEQFYRREQAILEARLGKEHPRLALCLNDLGDLYRVRGQFARAEPLLLRAWHILKSKLGKDHRDVATVTTNLGGLYLAQGQLARAEPFFRESLRIVEAKLGKDHPDTAEALVNLAGLYYEQRHLARAAALYQRALAIFETARGKDHPVVAKCCHNLASVYRAQGRLPQAETLLQRSLTIYEAHLPKNHPDLANTLNSLASVSEELGKYAQAEPLYQRSLRIREAAFGPDHPDVANSLHNLAGFYRNRGDYARAEPLFRRSLAILESRLGKDHYLVATSLDNLADLYKTLGELGRAEALIRRALRIRETTLGKDHPATARSLDHLAEVYLDRGNPGQAEALLRQSFRLMEARLGKDHVHLAYCLNNLARLYSNLGQLARAEECYLRSLQIYETRMGKEDIQVGILLHNLASFYESAGYLDRAEPLYRRSLAIHEKRLGKDDPSLAAGYNNLGNLLAKKGQHEQAETLVRQALRLQEDRLGKEHVQVAHTLNNLGLLYDSTERSGRAIPLLERSLAIYEKKLGPDHPDVANVLNNLGTARVLQRDWNGALAALDRNRRILRRHVARVLPALAEPEQLAFLQEVDDFSSFWALSFGLLRRGDPAAAARSAEWLLNRKGTAQQALAQRQLLARAATTPELKQTVQQLQSVRAHLARVSYGTPPAGQERARLRLLADLEERERELVKKLGTLVPFAERSDPWVTLEEVRRQLPAGAVLIDVVKLRVLDFQPRGNRPRKKLPPFEYAAWVIPAQEKGPVQVVPLGSAEKIDAAVAAVRRLLGEAPRTIPQLGEGRAERQTGRALQKLAGLVLEPLWKHIGGADQWVLSPDASLWLVPWAALPRPDGKYVLEKHRLHYVISGRDLAAPGRAAANQPALVLADPDFDGKAVAEKSAEKRRGPRSHNPLPNFPRLPATAAEARAIAPLLKKYAREEPRVYTGPRAQEGVLKAARQPRVLVLATHGFFLEDQDEAVAPQPSAVARRGLKLLELHRPRTQGHRVQWLENPLLRCGLALAGANQRDRAGADTDDGILTGLEIVGCDLRGTELVVLSACETGLGEVRNGEGVAGLRQAFQLAGARSVVATLWQIPDRETTALMTAFFTHLAAKTGMAEALRRAQLDLIRQRRAKGKAAHPFYWAAFTLTGQGR
jgi:CHAT domain-containing protein/Tfp pilus assembly protein PilF